MRVVFFGTPAFAVPSLRALFENGEEVVAVVTQPDKPAGRGRKVHRSPVKELALARGVPVLQPAKIKSGPFPDELRRLAPDMAVVAAYGKILTRQQLEIPRLGFVNVHASLLPKYRGACPIEWAILRGEKWTGVSIMKVTEGVDEGPVLLQEEAPIGAEETAGELEARLAEIGGRLIPRAMETIRSGTARFVEQDHSLATFSPKLSKEDARIPWTDSAASIHNRIRGMHPWPGAFTTFRGTRILVHRVRAGGELASLAPPAGRASPGEVVALDPCGPEVATGEGTLILAEVQPENRKRVSGRDFLHGSRIGVGERFE